MGDRHRNQDGSAIALRLMAGAGRDKIIFGGHKDRAPLSIAEQVSTRLPVKQKMIARSPVQYFWSTTTNNGNIKRLYLHLLKYLSRTGSNRGLSTKEL